MPKPATTPTDPTGLTIERVYDLLAADSAFQSWAGAANQAEAEAHLFYGFMEEAELHQFANDTDPESLPILMIGPPDTEDDQDDETRIAVETTFQLSVTLRFVVFKDIPTEAAQRSSHEASVHLLNEQGIIKGFLSDLQGKTASGVRLEHSGVRTVDRIAAAPWWDWFGPPDSDVATPDRRTYRAVYEIRFGTDEE